MIKKHIIWFEVKSAFHSPIEGFYMKIYIE